MLATVPGRCPGLGELQGLWPASAAALKLRPEGAGVRPAWGNAPGNGWPPPQLSAQRANDSPQNQSHTWSRAIGPLGRHNGNHKENAECSPPSQGVALGWENCRAFGPRRSRRPNFAPKGPGFAQPGATPQERVGPRHNYRPNGPTIPLKINPTRGPERLARWADTTEIITKMRNARHRPRALPWAGRTAGPLARVGSCSLPAGRRAVASEPEASASG